MVSWLTASDWLRSIYSPSKTTPKTAPQQGPAMELPPCCWISRTPLILEFSPPLQRTTPQKCEYLRIYPSKTHYPPICSAPSVSTFLFIYSFIYSFIHLFIVSALMISYCTSPVSVLYTVTLQRASLSPSFSRTALQHPSFLLLHPFPQRGSSFSRP